MSSVDTYEVEETLNSFARGLKGHSCLSKLINEILARVFIGNLGCLCNSGKRKFEISNGTHLDVLS